MKLTALPSGRKYKKCIKAKDSMFCNHGTLFIIFKIYFNRGLKY